MSWKNNEDAGDLSMMGAADASEFWAEDAPAPKITSNYYAPATTFKRAKSGAWVVCGPVNAVALGPVKVTLKSGKTRTVTIKALGKPFTVQWAGIDLVYGYLTAFESK